MDWQQILKNKKQTFNWSDKVPERKIIDQILDELHTYCPSKQNNVPYSIEVLDWSNPAERNEIFKNTWCDSNTPEDRRNPQVLAPYLFIWRSRDVGNPTDNSYSQLEIGLASMFVVASAVNYGLDIGFCGCHNQDDIILSVGFGYAGVKNGGKFWNPISQKEEWSPGIVPGNDTNDGQVKPNKSDYIKFH